MHSKLPLVWLDSSGERCKATTAFLASFVMIDEDNKEVECRLSYKGHEFGGYFAFAVFNKYQIPIRSGQMFRIYTYESEGQLMAWLESYTPPMTAKKKALLEAIAKL